MSGIKTTEEMLQLIEAMVKATSLTRTAKRIGIAPATLCRVLKHHRTVSAEIASFFGYKKTVVFVRKEVTALSEKHSNFSDEKPINPKDYL